MTVANCNKCGNEIEWFKMQNGKSHPVDPEPITIQTDRGTMEGFKSHFSTCSAMDNQKKSPSPNPNIPDDDLPF